MMYDAFSGAVATLDVETRGLGGAFLVGCIYADGEVRNFWTAEDLAFQLAAIAPRVVYVHNLEFDLRKMMKYLGLAVDWAGGHLVISGRVAKCQLVGVDIELRDSYKLLQGRLGDLVRDFGVGEKAELPEDLDHIKADDPGLLCRVGTDARLLFELVQKVWRLTDLPIDEWLKAVTTAGLAMRLYDRIERQWAREHLAGERLPLWLDVKLRHAYYGGRSEVFQPWARNAVHYDCNSLYPAVMGDEDYPLDVPAHSQTPHNDFQAYCKDSGPRFGVGWAEVTCPLDLDPPLLPYRVPDGRLIFPVGSFSGWWTFVELRAAAEAGYRVYVRDAYVSHKAGRIFRRFVELWEGEKRRASGARRAFAKHILVSLGGKFGQTREQLSYQQYSYDRLRRARDARKLVGETVILGEQLIATREPTYSYYLRVDIACHITAYARLRLWRMMRACKDAGQRVCYCDTDSIVTEGGELAGSVQGDTRFGAWRLVRRVQDGLYLLPKFYAELELDGVVTRKGRGVDTAFLRDVTYNRFGDWYRALMQGERRIPLYGYDGCPEGPRSFPGLLVALRRGLDLDDRTERRAKLSFDAPKRETDWTGNTTRPLRLARDDDGRVSLVGRGDTVRERGGVSGVVDRGKAIDSVAGQSA